MKTSLVLKILAMMLPMIMDAQEGEKTKQKTIIEPNQVVFAHDGMFAYIGGECVPLEAIYSDASGLLAAIKKDPNHNRWICSCKYNNNG